MLLIENYANVVNRKRDWEKKLISISLQYFKQLSCLIIKINWQIYRSLVDETEQRLRCFTIPEDQILNSFIYEATNL